MGEVPAGDRAVSGDRDQLVAPGTEGNITDNGRMALQDVQSQGSRRVETLEDRQQGAVSSRRSTTVALLQERADP